MSVVRWLTEKLTEKQPASGYLLGWLTALQRWLETKCSLGFRLNSAVRGRVQQPHGKAPRWTSEFYVVFAIAVAVVAYCLATPIGGLQWLAFLALGFLTVLWPSYRIFEVLVFLVGWVFVQEDKLHSIRRSLLAFLLNMIELSLLLGTLEVSVGGGLSQPGKLNHFFDSLVSIATIASPTATAASIQGAIEVVRLFASLLLVLIVVSCLAGGVLRRTVEPGEGK